ncbi:class I glutamine amidotransferase-like protein [Dichotomopilus funicola]|uniref:Class I glutamine amidotransferase-like protein n=1 Tax=Dichotomopilus funicola TaxID=1934379 RepID=A0AAN6UWN9_9PEZI|nr:class I glutamine amidotransferase-like protein [Dichotomopilus funicola]
MSPSRTLSPLRIAVLLNSYRSPFITDIRDSYVRTITAAANLGSEDDEANTTPELTFFYPAENEDELPDPDEYDLIVIGGGNVDPRRKMPWISKLHQFILDVVAHHPQTKLCGICWGHQTICMLFGAELVDMETPELGVTEAQLTPAGRRFLHRPNPINKDPTTLRLQQHHRRAVGSPPVRGGFHELLADNQAFLNHNNTILTWQGHPEKDAKCAKLRVRDATRWFSISAEEEKTALAEVEKVMGEEDDGREVWVRILEWVRGEHPGYQVHL